LKKVALIAVVIAIVGVCTFAGFELGKQSPGNRTPTAGATTTPASAVPESAGKTRGVATLTAPTMAVKVATTATARTTTAPRIIMDAKYQSVRDLVAAMVAGGAVCRDVSFQTDYPPQGTLNPYVGCRGGNKYTADTGIYVFTSHADALASAQSTISELAGVLPDAEVVGPNWEVSTVSPSFARKVLKAVGGQLISEPAVTATTSVTGSATNSATTPPATSVSSEHSLRLLSLNDLPLGWGPGPAGPGVRPFPAADAQKLGFSDYQEGSGSDSPVPYEQATETLWQLSSTQEATSVAEQALTTIEGGEASTYSPVSFPGIPADQVEAYTSNTTTDGIVVFESDCVVVRDGATVGEFLFFATIHNTGQTISPSALLATEQSIVLSVTQ